MRKLLTILAISWLAAPAFGAPLCRLAHKKSAAGIWETRLQSDPVFRKLLGTKGGYQLVQGFRAGSIQEFARLLDSKEASRLARAMDVRLEQVNYYISVIRNGRKARGEKINEETFTREESYLLDVYARRNLQLIDAEQTRADVRANRLENTENPIFEEREPKKPWELLKEKTEIREEKEGFFESLRSCRKRQSKKQMRENRLRAFGWAAGTTMAMTTWGHLSTYGWKEMKAKDIGTDMIAGVLSDGVKIAILTDPRVSFLVRYGVAQVFNSARTALDAWVYYVQPFKSADEKETRSNEHLDKTKRRAEFNVIYNAIMEWRSIAFLTLIQGLRCRVLENTLAIPLWAPGVMQLGSSTMFSYVYYNGRKYFVDDKHIDDVNEKAGQIGQGIKDKFL